MLKILVKQIKLKHIMIIKKRVFNIIMLVILKYKKNIIFHHIKNRFIKIIF